MVKKLKVFVLMICFVLPLVFVGCEKTEQKILSTPNVESVVNSHVVFTPVADAEYYVLKFNTDLSVKVDVNHSKNVQMIDGKVFYDASKIFVVGESYSIKVQACSTSDYDSGFSNEVSYKHMLTLATPTNLRINGTTLTWSDVENVSYYSIKVVTPLDGVLFDEMGNPLVAMDSLSIEKANIPTYTFTSNQFNFTSLLNKAGEYQFFVKAVNVEANSVTESDFSLGATYKYVQPLATPINQKIVETEDGYHLLCVIDENANALKIKCNEFERTVEMFADGNNNLSQTAVDAGIEKIGNWFDINLNKFFDGIIVGGKICDFNDLKLYALQTQAIYNSNSVQKKFYTDSSSTKEITFNTTKKLESPNVEINYNESLKCYQVKWNKVENASSYRMFVINKTVKKQADNSILRGENIVEYNFTSADTSMLIYEEFAGLFMQTVGSGNYLTSNFSNVYTLDKLTKCTVNNLEYNTSDLCYHWEGNADYYICENGTNFEIVCETKLYVPVETILANKNYFNVIAVKNNFACKQVAISVEAEDFLDVCKLDAPTFNNAVGFSSTQKNVLSFDAVKNAVGYYIWVKAGNGEFVKIDRLFTTSTVDLTSFLQGYETFEVKVQAVANKYDGYLDSDFSVSKTTSNVMHLKTPEWYKFNGVNTPVRLSYVGNTFKYELWFYEVENASSYKIFVNNNVKIVDANNKNALLKVDVTDILNSPNIYNISVMAIANETLTNLLNSEKINYTYAITKQLEQVKDAKIETLNGSYYLIFTPVNNAETYEVTINKFNRDGSREVEDEHFKEYLTSVGLSQTFTTEYSCDITKYLTGIYQYLDGSSRLKSYNNGGIYYFSIISKAKQGGYFSDSNVASRVTTITKKGSLGAPKIEDITLISDNNKDECLLSWDADTNADGYNVEIVDPFGYVYTVPTTEQHKNDNEENSNEMCVDVKKYLTIEGDYQIKIQALALTKVEYISSSVTNKTIAYSYTTKYDFERYKVSVFKNECDFCVDSWLELRNILWYHYLYSTDTSKTLTIYVDGNVGNNITAWASACGASEIEGWGDLATDNAKFEKLCEYLISTYPDFNILTGLQVERADVESQIFSIKFANELNVEKTLNTFVSVGSDYSNKYEYVKEIDRRKNNNFAIDALTDDKAEFVNTTEQLLQAVLANKKPKFFGECYVAETVFENAKNVLNAIIPSGEITDQEKITAIFDWLEYAFNFNNASNKVKQGTTFAETTLDVYGIRQEYYLEGIFLNLNNQEFGGFDGEFYLGNKTATSLSFAKAFSLLCGIEGIETEIVYNSFEYKTGETDLFAFNKVKLNDKWFNVDITNSEQYFEYDWAISSHLYFLCNDDELVGSWIDKTGNDLYNNSITCNESISYTKTATRSLTYDQLKTINKTKFIKNSTLTFGLEYDKNKTYSSLSNSITGLSNEQNFVVNAMMICAYNCKATNKLASCEITFDEETANSMVGSSSWAVVLNSVKNNFNAVYSFKYFTVLTVGNKLVICCQSY